MTDIVDDNKIDDDNNEYDYLPPDQQEDEDDISWKVSPDAVVVNSDWTIETINSQIIKGNIELQPKFQRRVAWDDKRKSRLIESILVGVPIPNIVLAENKKKRGAFIIIDGKQRLSSINEFIDDSYSLSGLDIKSELNGKKFSEMPLDDRSALENSTIRSSLIKNWRDESFLYTIFFRLNSGSLPLSPQELRRALSDDSGMLDSIDEYISYSKAFKKEFGPKKDRRMRDSELVLRFIAFDRSLQRYSGNLKFFLDDEIKEFSGFSKSRQQEELNKEYMRLDKALETVTEIFGKNSLKKWTGEKYERFVNRAIFDCMVRFFCEDNIYKGALDKSIDVENRFKALCENNRFKGFVEKTTKTPEATFGRITMWGEELSDCIGLSFDKNQLRII